MLSALKDQAVICRALTVLSLILRLQSSLAFVARHRLCHDFSLATHPRVSRTSLLNLLPLSKFHDSIDFFEEPDGYRCCIDANGTFFDGSEAYELGLVEEQDLPDLCRFVVTTFGADAIRLSQDMNAFERMLISPAAEFLNGYTTIVAFAEVYSGTKQRLKDRLNGPIRGQDISAPSLAGLSQKDKVLRAERDSLILILGRQVKDRTASDASSPPSTGSNRNAVDIIATIELRLQPCDAKIPFSLPWLDRVERRLGAVIGLGDGTGRELQPYLSNLCVDERYRGRKVGRALVRCVESIARTHWGYNRIYLHVDEDNVAARSLYTSEGYRDVGHRWNPFWSGNAANIGYYVKSLSRPSS